jgi:hypothetical protein
MQQTTNSYLKTILTLHLPVYVDIMYFKQFRAYFEKKNLILNKNPKQTLSILIFAFHHFRKMSQ